MIAFLCATPYQIFNAVNIKTSFFPDEEADIFLCTYTSDIAKFEKPCRNIFKGVYCIDLFCGNPSSIKVLYTLIYPGKELRRILKGKLYNKLFITCMGLINTVFYSELSSQNPQLELFYYDEGIGIYCVPLIKFSKHINLFLSIFRKKDYLKGIESLYAYYPDAVYANVEYSIQKIPPVNPAKKELFNSIFQYNKEADMYKHFRFIYLDQAFKKQLGIDVDNCFLLNYFVTITKNSEDYIIRKHPTRVPEDNEYNKINIAMSPKENTPWEVILLNMRDISSKILISINSTACITPKLLFDQEPYVILLYKLVPEFLNHYRVTLPQNERFFYSIKNCYRDTKKFFIPETFDQLASFLKEFSQETL